MTLRRTVFRRVPAKMNARLPERRPSGYGSKPHWSPFGRHMATHAVDPHIVSDVAPARRPSNACPVDADPYSACAAWRTRSAAFASAALQKTYGPPRLQGDLSRSPVISLLQRIRPRRHPPGQDGDTRALGPHKRRGVERRFLNQASRAPFDCQAISRHPLANIR